MNPPPPLMRLLGNPIVALGTLSAGGLFLYAINQDGTPGWQVAVGGLGLVYVIGDASEQRRRWLAWRREWEGFDDRRKLPSRTSILATIIAVVVAVVALGLGHPGEGDAAYFVRVGIGYALAAVPVGLWLAIRALRRGWRRRPRKAVPVASLASGVLPVLSLRRARDALPDYCKRLQ